MIYFDNVSKIYSNNSVALDDFSFAMSEGEFVSIVGRSGAGKSTILKLLLKEEKPTKGIITFRNKDVLKIKKRHTPLYRRNFGVVYQDFKLLPQKTVFENIAFALEILSKSQKEIQKRVPLILETVGILEKAHHFPHQISAGEKQRTAIARAIIGEPEVLLADEPTGNLDIFNARAIIKLLVKINDLGTPVLLVTHNREIVNSLGRRVVTLERGKVIKDEKVGRYYLSPHF